MTGPEMDVLLEKLPEPQLPPGARERFVSRYPERRRRGAWKWALAGLALTAAAAGAFTQPEAELSSAVYPLADGRMLVVRMVARPGAPAAWQWAARLKGSSGMKDGVWHHEAADRWTGRTFSLRVAAADLAASGAREVALSEDDGLYVRLSVDGAAPVPPFGPGEFVLQSPHVYLDGEELGPTGVERLSGTSLELARAGVGRFVLAMDAQGDRRFAPTGSAAGRRIEFQAAGHTWRIECRNELPVQGVLYVWHDRSYRTAQALEFGSGGWTPGR